MTDTPDDPKDPADSGTPSGDAGSGRKLDEDAAWRDIVAHYGDRAVVEPSAGVESVETAKPVDPGPADLAERERRLNDLFQSSWNDPLDSEASWDDEGHFVPPTPPPVVVQDPRRRAAWAGLFGSPFIMLVAVVLGWSLPGWLMLGLAAGFVGGFVYLVATMPNHRSGNGPGDGAVV